MTISAVICGRNDNYGGHLIERATYSINSLLETFDEVVYVDWNTEQGKKILTDELDIKDRSKLKVFTISPDKVMELIKGEQVPPMCEVLSRNIGIRRAIGDIIVSTNIDIIAPSREQLDIVTSKLRQMEMITVIRKDLELSEVNKVFGNTHLENENVPIIFGVDSIRTKLMSPFVEITKNKLEQFPEKNHHTLSSVICGCGDFQIAHRETWYKIRGFEESMKKRQYADTTVQYKVLMQNGIVRGSNFPPIYHLEHERDNSESILNSIEMVKTTLNEETWGFSHEDIILDL
jgi:hypothetical protein|tara:strand:- start:217 stop:1086 length:870 start_codon:yes stop_codon:yes gene_type:complete